MLKDLPKQKQTKLLLTFRKYFTKAAYLNERAVQHKIDLFIHGTKANAGIRMREQMTR